MRRKFSLSGGASGCGTLTTIFFIAVILSMLANCDVGAAIESFATGAMALGALVIFGLFIAAIVSAVKNAKNEAGDVKAAPDVSAKSSYSAADTEAKAVTVAPENEALQKARRQIVEERLINTKVTDPEVRQATNKVLAVADKIVATLKEKPERIPGSSQFLNYYLPTLGVILQKYKKLEGTGVDIHTTRTKVLDYMGDIERAMQKEYINLFQNDLLDLSVEMEAMTIACKRDGLLTDEDLQKAYEEQTINLSV